jgi:hypothetical protein
VPDWGKIFTDPEMQRLPPHPEVMALLPELTARGVRRVLDAVRLPETLELEPGTFVRIATPDGDLVHHLPTPGELAARFPAYSVLRLETVLTPIPFMRGQELPQLVFLAEK